MHRTKECVGINPKTMNNVVFPHHFPNGLLSGTCFECIPLSST